MIVADFQEWKRWEHFLNSNSSTIDQIPIPVLAQHYARISVARSQLVFFASPSLIPIVLIKIFRQTLSSPGLDSCDTNVVPFTRTDFTSDNDIDWFWPFGSSTRWILLSMPRCLHWQRYDRYYSSMGSESFLWWRYSCRELVLHTAKARHVFGLTALLNLTKRGGFL